MTALLLRDLEDEDLPLVLQLHDGADRPEIVADVQDPGRLDPGQNTLHLVSRVTSRNGRPET